MAVRIAVDVVEGRLDDALRRFKKKLESSKLMDEYKSKQFYLKPSLAKREKRKMRLKYG